MSAEKYPWCTHQELLMACVCSTIKPVLELGCGHYSTPILHYICKSMHRQLVSADHDPEWIKQFQYLSSQDHVFIVPDRGWDRFVLIDEIEWGVAFVDHNPGSRFAIDIARLRKKTELIVVHDTEPEKGLGLEPILDTFQYRFTDNTHSVHTTAVSDFIPIPDERVK